MKANTITKGRRKGREVRLTRSIRLEPTKKAMIESKHGTVQKWVDLRIEEEFGDDKIKSSSERIADF